MDVYNNIETVLPSIAKMGESPCWDEQNNILYFIDIVGKKLISFFPSDPQLKKWTLPTTPGTVALTNNNKLILALTSGIYAFDLASREFTKLTDPDPREHKASRFNDGKCDSCGRFWVGTTNMERKPVCWLYQYTAERGLVAYESNLTISNGLAWSPDNKKMYRVDTWISKVFSYDFDENTGNISNRRLIIEVPKENGLPDGMEVDVEGKLWIAHWGGYCVCRYDDETGQMLAKIETPVKYPTCCTFGGKSLNLLYITSAQNDDTNPMAGSLFKVSLPVAGMPTHRFLI